MDGWTDRQRAHQAHSTADSPPLSSRGPNESGTLKSHRPYRHPFEGPGDRRAWVSQKPIRAPIQRALQGCPIVSLSTNRRTRSYSKKNFGQTSVTPLILKVIPPNPMNRVSLPITLALKFQHTQSFQHPKSPQTQKPHKLLCLEKIANKN